MTTIRGLTASAALLGWGACVAPSPMPPLLPSAPSPSAVSAPMRELTCQGAEIHPPEFVLRHAGAGKATVSVANASSKQSLTERRLRVSSEGAPLGSVAIEVGRALGVDAVVTDGPAEEAVWLELANADLEELDKSLVAEMGIDAYLVRSTAKDDREVSTLYFETLSERIRRTRAKDVDIAPIETRIIEAPNALAIGIVDHFCHFDASPHGAATVVGDAIIARDFAGNLDLLQELVDAFKPRKRP